MITAENVAIRRETREGPGGPRFILNAIVHREAGIAFEEWALLNLKGGDLQIKVGLEKAVADLFRDLWEPLRTQAEVLARLAGEVDNYPPGVIDPGLRRDLIKAAADVVATLEEMPTPRDVVNREAERVDKERDRQWMAKWWPQLFGKGVES